MKGSYLLLLALAAGTSGAAHAQDATTALNPTLMTGWTGGAAVQDDLDRRAGRHHRTERADGSGNQAAESCARLPQFRAQFGRRDPRVRKLTRLCRRAGY